MTTTPLRSERHLLFICVAICCISILFASKQIQLSLFWTGFALACGFIWQMIHLYVVTKLRCSVTLFIILHVVITIIFISVPLLHGKIYNLQHTLYLLVQYFAFMGIGQSFVRLQWFKRQNKEN